MFFIVAVSCYAQNTSLALVDSLLLKGNYEKAIESSTTLDLAQLTKPEKAHLQYSLAQAYRFLNKQDLELQYLIQAREHYRDLDSLAMLDAINLEIISILVDSTKDFEKSRAYAEEYIIDAKKQEDPEKLSKAYRELAVIYYTSDKYPEEAVQYFRKALEESSKGTDEFLQGQNYHSLGASLAMLSAEKLDSSLLLYKKAMKIYQKYDKKSKIALLYINFGVAYHKLGRYQEALKEFHKADTASLDEFRLAVKSYVPYYAADTYRAMGNYKKALEAVELYHVYNDSIKEEDQKQAVKELEIRYKSAEKELENQKLASDIKIKNIALIWLVIALALIAVIGYLVFKFNRKKRKIAEQERELEKEKLKTVLREQQLHEIDIMLESQEKERQRIANELHDNLGSLLSALKLNFHTLGKRESQDKTSKVLFKKTEELINETYLQVRNVSHLKNLGVVGKEGLLTAVTKMADKMTVINRLQFNVIPFGLTGRLENSVEVTLFRIIQELSANIIKHSEATEVNIYLTQHKDSRLNIMIEDNGKGFDTSILKEERSGIGLKNIEKKVEQMDGSFSIDSSVDGGTTIIIDIPI